MSETEICDKGNEDNDEIDEKDTRPTKKPKLRARPYRSTCPYSLEQRIRRAEGQRLYLVERDNEIVDNKCKFAVLGSTGNVYNVVLQEIPSCNCPDWQRRGEACKHILFILLKCAGLCKTNPLCFQDAFTEEELMELFASVTKRRAGGSPASHMANANVILKYQASKDGKQEALEDDRDSSNRKSLETDNDCPICFDPMEDFAETTYCRTTCGTNFHTDCIKRWCANSHKATCPNCRQPWQGDGVKEGSDFKDEGYLNLGSLQGQSATREYYG